MMNCPSCKSSAVLYDTVRGEQVCTRCGFVILERLYELKPEWRRRPGEELERADVSSGVNVAVHDFGLGTKFNVPLDLPPSQRAHLRRMRVLQQRSRVMDWSDRSLREALMDLDKLCEDLSLPKGFKSEVSVYYRRARAKRLTVGRDARQILAALMFITCRLRGIPRTGGEISKAVAARFVLEERAILKSIRRFTKLLLSELGLKLPLISTDSYIDRFASQLALSQEAIIRAHEVVKDLPKGFIQGKPPHFLAAIAVYFCVEQTGGALTLREISGLFGIGVSSLSKNIAYLRRLKRAV